MNLRIYLALATTGIISFAVYKFAIYKHKIHKGVTINSTHHFGRTLKVCMAMHRDYLDQAVESGQIGLLMQKVVEKVVSDGARRWTKAEKRRKAKFVAKYKVSTYVFLIAEVARRYGL
jgi:hypothetical protein